MVALSAYVCGPYTHMQCSQKSALGLLELELQTSEPPCGCWGPNSGSSARAPGALTADRVSSPYPAFKPSLSHQGELVYPKALQAPQELGEPQLLLPPRFLHFLCYLGNHERLWCWTLSTGGRHRHGRMRAEIKCAHGHSVWEPGWGQGTPLYQQQQPYCLFLFVLVSLGNIWISASNTTI